MVKLAILVTIVWTNYSNLFFSLMYCFRLLVTIWWFEIFRASFGFNHLNLTCSSESITSRVLVLHQKVKPIISHFGSSWYQWKTSSALTISKSVIPVSSSTSLFKPSNGSSNCSTAPPTTSQTFSGGLSGARLIKTI